MIDEFANCEEYRHNRYLMQKIKEMEEDSDTGRRGHDEVWGAIGEKYAL